MAVNPSYLALGSSILIGVAAQVMLKIGSANSISVATQFSRPSTLVGLVLYSVSAIFYVLALRKVTISIAFPTVSLAYILIATIDHFWFKQPFGIAQFGGTLLIIAGVGLLHHSA
jgi:small multidrug resistance pump